jgi:hypothetical protein
MTTSIPSLDLSGIKRGCGYRLAGGIYATLETRNIAYGTNVPIDQFLQCPPMALDPNDIGLAAQGVLIKEGTSYGRPGVHDIFDWIGESHYPYVPDFIEEGRNYGFSRRIPKSAQIDLLTTDSLHIMGHPKAIIMNYKEFYEHRINCMTCPKGHEIHDTNVAEESCLGLLWETFNKPSEDDQIERSFTRRFPPANGSIDIPQIEYLAAYSIVDPIWQFGLFMTMPITAFEVIEDIFSDADQIAMELLEKSGTDIPYYLVKN